MVEQDSALIKVQSVVEGFMIRYFARIYRVRYMSYTRSNLLNEHSAAALTYHKIQMFISLLKRGSDACPVS